jgi:DNA (cytosine-5)-methyltransferase 1
MARFCEVVEPGNVIIENVPGVERDRSRVAQRTWQRLVDLGYRLDTGIIDASRLGVAQRRKRSVTIASREISPSVRTATGDVETRERDLAWAIGDLQGLESELIFDSPPSPTATNVDRIDYLFDEDLYELPDSQRPDCHRLKEHSYVSIYGRLHWDRPAQTLTTGFGTMGRGRHVHPSERRTITPHEAARIQFFPDFFDFGAAGRTLLQKIIGNAVPPKMGYALGLHLLR